MINPAALQRIKRLGTFPILFGAEVVLCRKKPKQRPRFLELRKRFPAILESLSHGDISSFVTPLWSHFNQQASIALLPYPPFDFLRDDVVSHNMVVDARGSWLRTQRRFVEEQVDPQQLGPLLIEDCVGMPRLAIARYLTSHTMVHHLYHFLKFQQATNVDVAVVGTVVDWGGGYGNQAKIFKRLNPDATYFVIDTPLFSAMQWLYLSSVLGEEEVTIATDPSLILQGKINLVPLGALKNLELSADLFVSTWALSESSRYSQDHVVGSQWFGARHLLLAFQEGYEQEGLSLPDAGRVGIAAAEAGAEVTSIPFLPGNHYAFS